MGYVVIFLIGGILCSSMMLSLHSKTVDKYAKRGFFISDNIRYVVTIDERDVKND